MNNLVPMPFHTLMSIFVAKNKYGNVESKHI